MKEACKTYITVASSTRISQPCAAHDIVYKQPTKLHADLISEPQHAILGFHVFFACAFLTKDSMPALVRTSICFIFIYFFHHACTTVVVWRNSSVVVSINGVNLCQARLVLGWVTMSGFNSWFRTFISVCNQPLRWTQPGHPFVGRHNE